MVYPICKETFMGFLHADQQGFLCQTSKLLHFQILMNYSDLYEGNEEEGILLPSNFYIWSHTNKDIGESV